MPAEFVVAKNALLPNDDNARAMFAKLGIGEVVDVTTLHGMNAKFNAKMMVAIDKMAKATGISTDRMRGRLMVLAGWCDVWRTPEGATVAVPQSMSRSSMTQAERERLWEDIKVQAVKHVLPVIDKQTADELREMFRP